MGQYLEDAKEHFPQYTFIEIEKNGIPKTTSHRTGESVIEVSTDDGIIIRVEEQ